MLYTHILIDMIDNKVVRVYVSDDDNVLEANLVTSDHQQMSYII